MPEEPKDAKPTRKPPPELSNPLKRLWTRLASSYLIHKVMELLDSTTLD